MSIETELWHDTFVGTALKKARNMTKRAGFRLFAGPVGPGPGANGKQQTLHHAKRVEALWRL
jgi:hypothetical protein